MLKIDDVYADFQYVGHKTLNVTFNYPIETSNEDALAVYVDYKIVHKKEDDNHFFGIVLFYVDINIKNEKILSLELEGAFIGNKNAYKFEVFEDMLEINGVASLSQIARLQIMNFTTNIGLKEPIVIPMINVVELKKKKNL